MLHTGPKGGLGSRLVRRCGPLFGARLTRRTWWGRRLGTREGAGEAVPLGFPMGNRDGTGTGEAVPLDSWIGERVGLVVGDTVCICLLFGICAVSERESERGEHTKRKFVSKQDEQVRLASGLSSRSI